MADQNATRQYEEEDRTKKIDNAATSTAGGRCHCVFVLHGHDQNDTRFRCQKGQRSQNTSGGFDVSGLFGGG